MTFTNNLTAWATSSTAAQAGGFVTVQGLAGIQFDAQGDGWVVLQILAGPTTTTGNVTFQITGSYDGVGLDNQNNQS